MPRRSSVVRRIEAAIVVAAVIVVIESEIDSELRPTPNVDAGQRCAEIDGINGSRAALIADGRNLWGARRRLEISDCQSGTTSEAAVVHIDAQCAMGRQGICARIAATCQLQRCREDRRALRNGGGIE